MDDEHIFKKLKQPLAEIATMRNELLKHFAQIFSKTTKYQHEMINDIAEVEYNLFHCNGDWTRDYMFVIFSN